MQAMEWRKFYITTRSYNKVLLTYLNFQEISGGKNMSVKSEVRIGNTWPPSPKTESTTVKEFVLISEPDKHLELDYMKISQRNN